MRRAIILSLALGLVAVACAEGRTFGDGLGDISTTIDPTESPAEKPKNDRPRPRGASPTPTPEEPKVVVNTFFLAVRDNNDGYEWRKSDEKKWKQVFTDPGPIAFVGDIIIFRNDDKQNNRHGWRNDAIPERGIAEGAIFDSPILNPGERWRWVVDAPLGQYVYSDSAVPYRAGGAGNGPMLVCDRETGNCG